MTRVQSGRAWVGAIAALMLLAVAVQVPWTQSAAVLPRRLALHALAVVLLLHAARRLRLGQVGAVACALGLWQALTWSASETSWMGMPRLMDGVAALVLLVGVTGGRLPRWALLWPLVVAGSVGAALGLVWVGNRLASKERRQVGATVALAVALALLLTPGPRLDWHAQRPYADSLASLSRLELGGRLSTWRNTLALIAAHPWLGVGPGGFTATYPAYHRAVVRDEAFSTGQQIEEPHNEPLRGAVEWGIPGLTLAVLLAVALLRGVPRRAGRRTVGGTDGAAGPLLAGLPHLRGCPHPAPGRRRWRSWREMRAIAPRPHRRGSAMHLSPPAC